MAKSDQARRELNKARNVFKQFRNTPQLRTLSDTVLAIEPVDEEDAEFANVLDWALTTLTHQGILLAAHDAVGGTARYRERVREIQESLLRQVDLDTQAAEAPQQHPSFPPALTLLPGGKNDRE
jgi:hypothetical protein